MNAQTSKLFAQALDEAVPETWTTLTPRQLAKVAEKFSELLVRECMDVVLDKDGKEWSGYVHVCREESAGMIKKHFGVEQ